jgi:hypothetical protein
MNIRHVPSKTIAIQDHDRKKAALWDALQDGEIGADDAKIIDDALSFYSEHMRREASRLDTMDRQLRLKGSAYYQEQALGLHRAALHVNLIASRAQAVRDKFQDGGNAYIMPEDA